MKIYSMKTEGRTNPVGIDEDNPVFSWKISSEKRGVSQKRYMIEVSEDEAFSDPVWNSGYVDSDISLGIRYGGKKLLSSVRYYWRVSVEDNYGRSCTSPTAFFETGLKGTDSSVWSGAMWIGSPVRTDNTDGVYRYKITAEFAVTNGSMAGIAIAARNKGNYVLIETDVDKHVIRMYRYNDNEGDLSVTQLGDVYKIPEYALPDEEKHRKNKIEICINGTKIAVLVNGYTVIDNEDIMPQDRENVPREEGMMLFGLKQVNSKAVYYNIKIENMDGTVYQNDSFKDDSGILSALGTVKDGKLIVENEFSLVSAVPPVNVRKSFDIEKKVRRARLYASAKGFYNAYINGVKINRAFYNPGFTDYRKRIQYQVYDVTDSIVNGSNVIGAVVAKGYYTGFVGYNRYPMVYGRQNYFICKLVIDFEDGTRETIVTDGTWEFTDKGPVIDSDYQQGESYDARLEFDWNNMNDSRWRSCGIAEWDREVTPTNGSLPVEKFEMSAQKNEGAVIERVITPELSYTDDSHFIYDFGQNMVGTIRLRLKGKVGRTIKLRYGEICRKDGRLYTANLRTAANTDTYTFKGDIKDEIFMPEFTAHGFRYMEITGLAKEEIKEMVIGIEGLVITDTPEKAGYFECSDPLVNRLCRNIEWGQTGNSLLVYTDCPQRNERMGWTGDAEVFAATAAYNMYVRAFMDKWLLDMRDGQLMYNKNDAVPDTVPLGGDNRPDGCAGWGDAAVIVPWEMYLAYGDVKILEDNYEMMSKWIGYQSRDDRQNNGIRYVDGEAVPEKSDLASEAFIQVQQRRGDHLAYDNSTPYIYIATAYAAYSAKIMAKVARVLGREKDADKYYKRFINIKRAFNEAWVKDDGTIAYWGEMSERTPQNTPCIALDGSITRYTYYEEGTEHCPSQTAYALAIDFGLIPDDKMNGAAMGMKAALKRNNNHLSVGFLGISHLIPALTKAGLTEEAFRLLQNEDNPSWLYSVRNGATTIWERWDSYIAETDTFGDVAMNSFNHYAYGAVGQWLYSDILGIKKSGKPDDAGYKKFILQPTVGGTLEYAKGKYESAYGEIISEWKIDCDKLIYKCNVPANTSALLRLPVKDSASITESGSSVYVSENTIYLGTDNGRAIFKLESGSYMFETVFDPF